MNNWQPIETAPKDGTVVDLWTAAGREPCARWNDRKQRWEIYWIDSFESLDWITLDYPPTHWMPLPDPPS